MAIPWEIPESLKPETRAGWTLTFTTVILFVILLSCLGFCISCIITTWGWDKCMKTCKFIPVEDCAEHDYIKKEPEEESFRNIRRRKKKEGFSSVSTRPKMYKPYY